MGPQGQRRRAGVIRTLDRLVLSSFLRLFAVFVLAAPLLFILGDVTENLDGYLEQGIPFERIALSYVFAYPQFMFWCFPIAALLATVFTIHPMTIHREVMATKAGGISFHRLALPIIVAGALLSGVGLVLADLAPRSMEIASELRGDRERRQAFRSTFVYLTDAGGSLMARRLTANDGQMLGPSLQTFPSDPTQPTRYVMADHARWLEGRGWMFEDGYRRELHPDGREVTVHFDRSLERDLSERPEELLEAFRDEDEMTYAELTRFGDRLLRSGGEVGRTFTKRGQRVAIPAATLVIVLFGAPLATSSKRGGGTAYGIGIALATTILYLMLFRVAGAFGYAGTLDPTAAAWIPNVVFLCAGLVLMKKVRT
ncbi:MAG: YjgP/YjgQ family permease [Gemmatimonadetes bacterium]|nr:YjgP/YjgQ family permease [Gemmatimonadota bacterium]